MKVSIEVIEEDLVRRKVSFSSFPLGHRYGDYIRAFEKEDDGSHWILESAKVLADLRLGDEISLINLQNLFKDLKAIKRVEIFDNEGRGLKTDVRWVDSFSSWLRGKVVGLEETE